MTMAHYWQKIHVIKFKMHIIFIKKGNCKPTVADRFEIWFIVNEWEINDLGLTRQADSEWIHINCFSQGYVSTFNGVIEEF